MRSSRASVRTLSPNGKRQVAEFRITGMSLQTIGKRLGLSGEQVRQIEARLRTQAQLGPRPFSTETRFR